MMLSDMVLLVLSLGLLLFGLQAFMDPDRRKVPSEVIKATFLMIASFFLMYLWQQGVSANKASMTGAYSV